ncbi:MAG: hypothetical protein PHR45_07385 [Muribaculaceae bacterium]|nr:hypothetical protein [Muribaculaceae bacterium]
MKQIYVKSLMLIACLLTGINANAYNYIFDGIYYHIDFVYYHLKRCGVASGPNKYLGKIIIPRTIVFENETLSVTSIISGAFSECRGLTSVAIPNSVLQLNIWLSTSAVD